ncbi:MAG: arginine--tRNA ligase [Rickettsiales bacterium]|jgi:arginyl-tRNA synthetase|nr:arginine--tRNA ligase [Rickettsiales bacterium]
MNIPKILSESAKKISARYSDIKFEAAKNPAHGDYATNAAMAAAKKLGKNPMELAAQIAIDLTLMPEVESASVAAPGFVNIVLTDKFLIDAARGADKITQTAAPLKIDMDYGSYNIAKTLQIGHLRTTIVGDVLNRILRATGNKTIAYNHLGDWGRPMGMVIAWILKKYPGRIPKDIPVQELNAFYPESSARAKEDPAWLEFAQKITSQFQNGNPEYMEIYDWFHKISIDDIMDALDMLHVLPFDYWRGERYASQFVEQAGKILESKKLIEKDQGAEIVRIKGDTPPLMWKTSHGTETYAATDLAAVYYRSADDNPDKIVYLTDVRQKLHFQQMFDVAKRAELTRAELTHLYFGAITGKDGKPFKTRSGNAPALGDIIDTTLEAVRARADAAGKNLSPEDIRKIAISALKFNDLSHGVADNYVFEPEALVSFEGRTGPYILYTARRLASIMAKAGGGGKFGEKIDGAGERALVMTLSDFDRIVAKAADSFSTELVANYAYDLAQAINNYYHNYPILKSDNPHRLAMVSVSLAVLSRAIELLGMQIPSEM